MFYKRQMSGWHWNFQIFNFGRKFLPQFLPKCRWLHLVYIQHKKQHVLCIVNLPSGCDWRMPWMSKWPGNFEILVLIMLLFPLFKNYAIQIQAFVLTFLLTIGYVEHIECLLTLFSNYFWFKNFIQVKNLRTVPVW